MSGRTEFGVEWCRRCGTHQALTVHGGICPVCDPKQGKEVVERAADTLASIDAVLAAPDPVAWIDQAVWERAGRALLPAISGARVSVASVGASVDDDTAWTNIGYADGIALGFDGSRTEDEFTMYRQRHVLTMDVGAIPFTPEQLAVLFGPRYVYTEQATITTTRDDDDDHIGRLGDIPRHTGQVTHVAEANGREFSCAPGGATVNWVRDAPHPYTVTGFGDGVGPVVIRAETIRTVNA